MKLIVGSLNRTKINAVKTVFPNAIVKGVDVPSQVSAQPIGDDETRQGAINRAVAAKEMERGVCGIGLEGGVMVIGEELYVCNWGALVTDQGKVFTAGGARIRLPNQFKEEISSGKELSEVMDNYTKKENIRFHEGAIGIFTNGHLLREEMFAQVVMLLRGQLEYWELNGK